MIMRVVFLALGLITVTDRFVLAQPRHGEQPAANYGWIFNFEQGKALARASGKPLMVVVRCVP